MAIFTSLIKSVPKFIKKSALVLFICSLNINAYAAINIKAPSIAENGAVVPVTASLDAPLQPGQTLNIYANGQLACSVIPNSFAVSMFSTRVRMQSSGQVLMQVVNQQGQVIDSNSFTVNVTIGATIPGSGNSNTQVRTRAKGNSVKALFTNSMAVNGHISRIEVNTSAGNLSINTTPYMSQNPYIGLTSAQDLGNVNITTNLGSGGAVPSAPMISAPSATPSAPATTNNPVSGYGGSGAY